MKGNIYFAVLPILSLLGASELPEWHMKPIGSHIRPLPVDETFTNDHNIITGHDFANKYVLPGKPVVFRNVVKSWPAYTLWTDEYLSKKYGDMEMRLEAKKEKRGRVPKGDVCLGRDKLRTFLNDYVKGVDKYIVSELPSPMWGEVHVPPPMACGEFLKSYVEIDVWMNSDTGKMGKGGSSLLHKDSFNTVNCVLNGTKEWKLIELQYNNYLYQSWEGPLDAGYGGFSLINPDKVDAKEYPNVGKLPRWQFVKINAGDCLFVPSQMWHQVQSYGATNRAVAFLFSQFLKQDAINTTGCDDTKFDLPLSDVDVDLQYPGMGVMTMGNTDIETTREYLMELVDEKTGRITKRSTYVFVFRGHSQGAINNNIILKKSKSLYRLMFEAAGGSKELLTENLIGNLTRDQIRATYELITQIDASNTYNYEYSFILPEDIMDMIDSVKESNGGKLEKEKLINTYEDNGGTRVFAERLWTALAGDKVVVENISAKVLIGALEPYEENRRENPNAAEEFGDDATNTTPQGHVTQPKRKQGGYSKKEEEIQDEDIYGDNNPNIIDNDKRNSKENIDLDSEDIFIDKKDEL